MRKLIQYVYMNTYTHTDHKLHNSYAIPGRRGPAMCFHCHMSNEYDKLGPLYCSNLTHSTTPTAG